MSEASISQVRSFNRLVAERVGAVGEDFLGRKRTLGESRVLWEIGPDGIDVRALRPASVSTPDTSAVSSAHSSTTGSSRSRPIQVTGASDASP